MSKLNLNELAALQLVLEFIPAKDLLIAAMNQFSEQNDPRSIDNADLCCKAIVSFLD